MPHYESRSTIYLADPRTLTVDWTKNLSRGGVEPTIDDKLIALALSMMPKDSDPTGSSGQIHPILCRQAGNSGPVTVVGGYRRYQAALYLANGQCPDFKVKYTVSKLNDLDAALANMDENMQREDPAPMELARAVRRLTEDFGMTIESVAARLKRSTGYLSQLLNLLVLPHQIQEAIASGTATVTAGIELARLPEADQTAVFKEVKAASLNGKVKAASVRKAARKKAEQVGLGGGTPAWRTGTTPSSMGGKSAATATVAATKPAKPARALKRSLKDLESFLEDRASIGEPQTGQSFANVLLDFIDGKKSEADMEGAWSELFA